MQKNELTQKEISILKKLLSVYEGELTELDKASNEQYLLTASIARKLDEMQFHSNLGAVIETIAKRPVEEPIFFYEFPKHADFSVKELTRWFDNTMLYYQIAKRWESQERGYLCSTDRAYHNYLKPKCQELLDYLNKNNSQSKEQ